jgi:hypothetical protein
VGTPTGGIITLLQGLYDFSPTGAWVVLSLIHFKPKWMHALNSTSITLWNTTHDPSVVTELYQEGTMGNTLTRIRQKQFRIKPVVSQSGFDEVSDSLKVVTLRSRNDHFLAGMKNREGAGTNLDAQRLTRRSSTLIDLQLV